MTFFLKKQCFFQYFNSTSYLIILEKNAHLQKIVFSPRELNMKISFRHFTYIFMPIATDLVIYYSMPTITIIFIHIYVFAHKSGKPRFIHILKVERPFFLRLSNCGLLSKNVKINNIGKITSGVALHFVH